MNQQVTTDRWKQALQQLAQRCPQCGVTWLVFGAAHMDSYTCKSCGRNFAIRAKTDEAASETSDAGDDVKPDQAA